MTQRQIIRDLIVLSPLLLPLLIAIPFRLLSIAPSADWFELYYILFLTLSLLVQLVGFFSAFSLERSVLERVFWVVVLALGNLFGFYVFYFVRLRRALHESAKTGA